MTTDYTARFANHPPVRLPEPSAFWKHSTAVEYHISRRTPLYEYLTAPRGLDEPPRCQMQTKLDNGDLLARFKQIHLERAIAHIWRIP